MWNSYPRKSKLIDLKFGLTGDTHNNLKNIEKICEIFNSCSVDFVIHTGDITLPKSLEVFKLLEMPLKGVFGNNDLDEKDSLLEVCDKYSFAFSDLLKIDLPNKRVLYAIHDPEDLKDYFFEDNNIIVHGHTHRYRDEILNGSYIFNPGECAGIMKGMNQVGIVSVFESKMDIVKF